MKRLSMIALAALTIAGCKNADDIVTPNRPQSSSMTATIDSVAFLTQDVSGTETALSLSLNGTKNAGTGKQSAISLRINHLNGLISYPLTDTSNLASYTLNGVVYNAHSGSISLSTDNEIHVAGTFEFEAMAAGTDTKTISQGSFDVYK